MSCKKILLSFFFFIFFLSFKEANAQTLGLGIYPPVLQIETTPPSSIKANITVQNQTDQNASYTIFLEPFTASGNYNGQPQFDSTLLTTYKSFFDKVQITDGTHTIQNLTLAPKQKKNLVMHVGLPKDEKPQDYYFSVIFISNPTGKSDNSAISARGGVGTNVLLSVGPKPPASGRISDFSAPGFITGGPVKMNLQVQNTGKSYIAPKGNILIRNMFGQAVGQVKTLPVNILSQSRRFIPSEGKNQGENPKVIWNTNFLLGFYTATATISLSDQGPVLTKKLTFLAFPVEGILGIIVCLLLAVAIFQRVKAKKRETY